MSCGTAELKWVKTNESVSIQLIFCIAIHKNEITYREIFSSIKELNATLNLTNRFRKSSYKCNDRCIFQVPNFKCVFLTGDLETYSIFRAPTRFQNEEQYAIIIEQFQAFASVPPIDVVPCDKELIDSLGQGFF